MDMLFINFVVQSFIFISILSVIWKDNIFFRFISNSYVGCSVGAYTVLAINAISMGVVTPIFKGDVSLVIPLVLGILILTNQLGKNISWVSRYPLWIVMGIGTALAIRGSIHAEILGQIITLFKFATVGTTPMGTFDNIVQIVFTILTFVYFFFYFIHKSPAGKAIQNVARLPIMLAFGISFATGLMMNLLFGAWAVLWAIQLGPESVPGSILTPLFIELVFIVGITAVIHYTENAKPKSQIAKTES